MAFYLTDDGTLDTVVACEHCGQEERYNFDYGDPFDEITEDRAEELYQEFVRWALDDADNHHDDCGDSA